MNEKMQTGIDEVHEGLPAVPASILLVEDDPAVREVTRNVLEMGGYLVLTADGPAEAAGIVGNLSTRIDLLLTDVIMPEMNGLQLAKQIRESRPDLDALFMTGYAGTEILRLAGTLPTYIQKPFTVTGLLSRVAEALATRWHNTTRIREPQHTTQ